MGQVEIRLRQAVAILRITIGVILVATWYDNLRGGIYTADGIIGLFNYIFNEHARRPGLLPGDNQQHDSCRCLGLFAVFQLVAELLMGLALLVGLFTPLAAVGAALFFLQSVPGQLSAATSGSGPMCC